MSTENQNGAPSPTEMTGELTDAELNTVSGGDKATTTTKPPAQPTDKVKYMEFKLQQVLISS
jgi:bacteriocin-like protein